MINKKYVIQFHYKLLQYESNCRHNVYAFNIPNVMNSYINTYRK